MRALLVAGVLAVVVAQAGTARAQFFSPGPLARPAVTPVSHPAGHTRWLGLPPGA